MNPVVRYSLLRLTLFGAVALGVYAVGARGWLWALMSILISAALAYVVLRGPRDDVARQLSDRVEGRVSGKLDRKIDQDNAAEDADNS